MLHLEYNNAYEGKSPSLGGGFRGRPEIKKNLLREQKVFFESLKL